MPEYAAHVSGLKERNVAHPNYGFTDGTAAIISVQPPFEPGESFSNMVLGFERGSHQTLTHIATTGEATHLLATTYNGYGQPDSGEGRIRETAARIADVLQLMDQAIGTPAAHVDEGLATNYVKDTPTPYPRSQR